MRRSLLTLAPLVLGALTCAACSGGKPVRIVLVTLDTLRYDRFEGERACMPELAELAREGLVFDQFYSTTSSTLPTHATLFTGVNPWLHGVPRNGTRLADEHTTLAEELREHGFRTAAAVASFAVNSSFHIDQGFEVYDDDFVQDRFNPAEVVTDRALNMLDGLAGEDHFLWVHYFDPHPPYGASAGSNLRTSALLRAAEQDPSSLPGLLDRVVRLYDQDVAYLDREFARVLRRVLDEREEYETHVLLTADHGESLGEHGAFGHGKGLWREQVHIPTMLWSPAIEPGRSGETAGSIDVMPTLLRLAGIEPAPDLPGRDLTQAMPARREIFGMRRTFDSPFEDVRADGSVVLVQAPSFYRVRDGALAIGDDESVGGEAQLSEEESGALQQAFADLERELLATPVDMVEDEDTRAGLGDLGYTE